VSTATLHRDGEAVGRGSRWRSVNNKAGRAWRPHATKTSGKWATGRRRAAGQGGEYAFPQHGRIDGAVTDDKSRWPRVSDKKRPASQPEMRGSQFFLILPALTIHARWPRFSRFRWTAHDRTIRTQPLALKWSHSKPTKIQKVADDSHKHQTPKPFLRLFSSNHWNGREAHNPGSFLGEETERDR